MQAIPQALSSLYMLPPRDENDKGFSLVYQKGLMLDGLDSSGKTDKVAISQDSVFKIMGKLLIKIQDSLCLIG